jgi:ATP-dependent Clp protease ATP-binding subunit ClpA
MAGDSCIGVRIVSTVASEDQVKDNVANEPREWFHLSPDIIASLNITAQLQVLSESMLLASPFTGEQVYESALEGVFRTLCRRQMRHVLLVGERGAGATSLLGEMAMRMLRSEPSQLKDMQVVLADARHLLAEESRERVALILQAVAAQEDVILAIDGFGKLLRSPRWGSNRDLLLSMVAQSSCRLIGLLTPAEYEEQFAGQRDLLEHFARVDLPEPDAKLACKLVTHYSSGLAGQFGLSLPGEVVRRAVQLADTYIFDERQPGKSLKVLQRACENLEYNRAQGLEPRAELTLDDITSAVAEMTGVSSATLAGVGESRDYQAALCQVVVGQEHAISQVATELSLIHAGLIDPDKPASVMLFVGQTGTGKTETAKALAKLYSSSKRLMTYALGNFVEPHSVSGIIGVPAGYVGHDAGGRLVNELNSDPYGVFLLDEADKAHPDVLQPLLNLFDEGWLVDQRGVRARASQAIFILTTNVGQKMIAEMAAKGNTPEEIATRMKETLAQLKHPKAQRPVFAPEFLARIKRIVVFSSLTRAAMLGICQKLVAEMQQFWKGNRQKELRVGDAVLEHIADESHRKNEASKGKEGGRIVRKLLADLIETPIQQAIDRETKRFMQASAIRVELHFEEENEQAAEEEEKDKKGPKAVVEVTFAS